MEATYIEFTYPGTLVAETSSGPVPRRELPETIPGRATAYRFYSRQETEVNGEKLVGQPKDCSPWAYFGKEYSASEVYALEGDRYRVLRDNVRINGYQRMVQTIYGNWYPLQDGDQVVPDAGVERES
jgi:hypothetical protein